MKKNILAPVIFYTLATASLTCFAGATNTDSTATDGGSSTMAVPDPNSDTRNMSTEASNLNDMDDGESDFGWIGLIGLVGLAGLMKRDRVDTTRTQTR